MTENANKKISKNPEVVEKAARRRFTEEYKRRIAIEAEACTQPGEIGALLRREGLYSSVVRAWRRQLRDRIIAIIEKVQQSSVTGKTVSGKRERFSETRERTPERKAPPGGVDH